MTIQEMRERRTALLAKSRATVDRARNAAREMTKAEQTEVEADLEELRSLDVQLKARAAARKSWDGLDLTGEVGNADPRYGGPSDDSTATGSKGRRSFEAQARQFADSAIKGFRDAGTNAKAATIAAQGLFTAGTAYVPGTQEEVIGPDPRLGLLGLVEAEEILPGNGNMFSYLQEATHVSGAAVVPDGVEKPESEYALKELTDRIKYVATISKPFPARYLEDYEVAGFRRWLQTTMARDIYRAVNAELLTGDGTDIHLQGLLATTGVQQQAWATDLPTTLRKSLTRLSNIDEIPSAFLMNPTDIEAVDLYKDTTGRWVSLKGQMGNLPIVPAPGLPVGTAILGNWALAKTVMFKGDSVRMAVTDSVPFTTGNDVNGNPIIQGNDHSRNQIRIRSEVRIGGLATSRPSGFVVIDVSAL